MNTEGVIHSPNECSDRPGSTTSQYCQYCKAVKKDWEGGEATIYCMCVCVPCMYVGDGQVGKMQHPTKDLFAVHPLVVKSGITQPASLSPACSSPSPSSSLQYSDSELDSQQAQK